MSCVLFALFILFPFNSHARDLEKKYKKDLFTLGSQAFEAYVADTEEKRSDGLMFIDKMPVNRGMLFVFEQAQPLSFWMKNTLLPLSIGFIDKAGVLIDIQEMKVGKSLMNLEVPTYQSRGPALFALEMNAGWFAKYGVKEGAHLKLKKASASALLNRQLSSAKTSRQ